MGGGAMWVQGLRGGAAQVEPLKGVWVISGLAS